MLRTAGVFAEPSHEDGLRIYTAGRETLDDGVTEHPLLQVGVGYDLWWPELAPDGNVYWKWHTGKIDWNGFEEKYLEKMRTNGDSLIRIAALAGRAIRGDVTVLCTDVEPHFCHRRLLAEEMSRKFPSLEVLIN